MNRSSLSPYWKFLCENRGKMLLNSAQSFSILISGGENRSGSFSPVSSSSLRKNLAGRSGNRFLPCAASKNKALTGVVFEPFEEVKKELMLIPSAPQDSLARHKYVDECEAAIDEQINVEYSVSYVYHSMFAYFDRDNVALKGFAKFFKESSDEERGHAEQLMYYQKRWKSELAKYVDACF